MPRSTTSPAGKTLEFFNSAELPMAELVLGLATDAVRGRQRRSQEAKARAHKVLQPAFSAAKPKRVVKAKRNGKKPAAVPA